MTELKVRAERVSFGSEGVELAGEFRASAAGAAGWQPGVVLTGPFTGVKEQVTGTYAGLLAAAGFATLAFDHRGFGESGGRRWHEDSQGKLADLRAAVRVLASPAEVDAASIGIVGICLGGYAVRAAAADPRVKAVAGIAGGYNSPVLVLQATGAGPYRSALAAALDRYDEYMPAVGAAELLAGTPLLIVHGKTDDYCSPELAQALYERKPGEKEIRWLDASQHIDFHDSQAHVTTAVQAAAGFLRRALG